MSSGRTPSSVESVADTLAGHDTGDVAPDIARGTLVGRFVVLEEAGKGGVGVVYAAYDAELDRRIALKLLRAAPGPRERHQLALLHEARSMAKLGHPNVVAVHDVGLDNGRVWVAMEFVEGQTLRRWVRDTPRSQREIVDVFVAAGRGLAAAHAAGLAHRDFKPENVLVGDDGRARVTDFGLAHASASDASNEPVDGSSPSMIMKEIGTATIAKHVGTPAYMAPEQLAGGRGDAKSDQFSFAVALFEALWGARPFRGVAIPELVANVVGGKVVEPPGVRVPRRLRQAVMQGLAVDPDGRHADMNAFVHALVRANAKPARAVALAGLGVATLVAGIGIALARTNASEVCTGAAAELAGVWDDDVRARVDSALVATNTSYAADTSQRAAVLLDDWSARWQAEHEDACAATNLRKDQSEAVMDRRMACLGRQRDQASALVELMLAADATTVEKAIGALQALPSPRRCSDVASLLAGPEPPDAAQAEGVARIRSGISRVQAHEDAGAYAQGLELARTLADDADELGYDPARAEAHTRVGVLAMRSGAPDDARASLERAYFLAVEHAHAEVAAEAAAMLAWVLSDGLGQRDAGAEWAKHALAQARHAGPDGPIEARARTAAGLVALTSSRFVDSLEEYRLALAIRERVLPADHLDIAQSRSGIAGALKGLGRTDEALEQQALVAEIRTRALGEHHPLIAMTYVNLGAILLQAEREEEAERWLRKALAIAEPALGPAHPTVASIVDNLGIALDHEHRDAEAVELFRRSLAIREAKLGPTHPHVAMTLNNLSIVLGELRRWDEAVAVQERAVAIDEQTLGADHPDVAVRLVNLATTLQKVGRPDDSLVTARRAWAIAEPRMERGDPMRADTAKQLASILVEAGRPNEAIALVEAELPHAEGIVATEMRFVLARATFAAGGSKVRVRELAESARRELVTAGPRGADLLRSLDAWIATDGARAWD